MVLKISRGLLIVGIAVVLFTAVVSAGSSLEPCYANPDPVQKAGGVSVNASVIGERTVRLTYNMAEQNRYVLTIPERATVVRKEGFRGGRVERWDGTTQYPVIEYRVNTSPVGITRTGLDGDKFLAGDGWVFGPLPKTGIRTFYSEKQVVGSTRGALIGDFNVESTSNGCHTIHVVQDVGANKKTNLNRTASFISEVDKALDIGYRYEDVYLFSLPIDSDEYPGYATGNIAVIDTDEELYGLKPSTWVHEYVHTRQSFGPRSTLFGLIWVTEATANYYAVKLPYELGYVSKMQYDSAMAWVWLRTSNATLSRPSTWAGREVPYTNGVIFLSRFEKELSKSEMSVRDATRWMNSQHQITYHEFYKWTEQNAGKETAQWVEDNVQSPVRPSYESESGLPVSALVVFGFYYQYPIEFISLVIVVIILTGLVVKRVFGLYQNRGGDFS